MNNIRPISSEECARRLLSLSAPIILTHRSPDGDTIGTGAALTLALRSLGKKARLLCPDPIPRRLEFLLEGVDMVDEPTGDEIVAVDIASRTMLGRLENTDVTLIIDHHGCAAPFADYYTLPDISSAGEVLYLVLSELEKISDFKIDQKIAYCIYAAISSDTGGFIYSSVSPRTLRIAADLIEYGIDFADINHRLFNSKSPEQIKAEGFVASSLKTTLSGTVAYASLTIAEREALGLEPSDFETAVDVVRATLGATVAVFVRETEPQKFRTNLRSTGLNVAAVARELGGGGHERAAGCTVSADSIDEALKTVLEVIKKHIYK